MKFNCRRKQHWIKSGLLGVWIWELDVIYTLWISKMDCVDCKCFLECLFLHYGWFFIYFHLTFLWFEELNKYGCRINCSRIVFFSPRPRCCSSPTSQLVLAQTGVIQPFVPVTFLLLWVTWKPFMTCPLPSWAALSVPLDFRHGRLEVFK